METKYVHFTPAEKDRAHNTNLAEFLLSQGEQLKRSGSEYQWMDGSEKVTIRNNVWFHQYEQQGGDAVSFVQRYYDKSYPEAVQFLLGSGAGQIIPFESTAKEKKEFALPPRNDNSRRAASYLMHTRGIDHDVLLSFYRAGMFYESADYHNAVFVGFDADGVPRHATMRGIGKGTQFKCNAESSDPRYSFHWHGTNGILLAFEAPIDMLSMITMANRNGTGWEQNSYCACCGVSDQVIRQMFKDNENLKSCFICFDNDEKGQMMGRRIKEALIADGIPSEILIPQHKDWNEDLLDELKIMESEGVQPCQALAL